MFCYEMIERDEITLLEIYTVVVTVAVFNGSSRFRNPFKK